MRPVHQKFAMHFGFNELYPPELRHLTKDGKHKGQDYLTPKGTIVFAALDGIISAIDYWRGFGQVFVVKFHSGWLLNKKQYRLILAHLDLILSKKKVGDKVGKMEQIALSGDSGMALGHPHLHAQIDELVDRTWVPIDPAPFIGNA